MAMEINLGFSGLGEAVNRLREMERLTASIARNQQGGGGAASSAGTAAQAATRATAAGPMARQATAQTRLAEAVAGGDAAKIFDAQVQATRAQASVDRAQRLLRGTTQRDRLMNLITTTRIGGGGALGGAMPLVGRLGAAIGGEAGAAMAGPIGAAVAGASLAIHAFTTLMQDANQSVGEFRRGMAVTGGTAGQTAQLAAMGIAPGQQGAAAASLRERLVTDSRAMGAAQRIGLQLPGHRLAGGVNEAQGLRDALERLRVIGKLEGAERQLFEARELQLEGYLDQIRVSDRVWKAQQQGAAVQAEIMRGAAGDFRDFAGQADRAKMSFDTFKASVAAPFAPAAGTVLGGGADLMNAASIAVKATTFLSGAVMEGAVPWVFKVGDAFRFITEKVRGGGGDATEKNTAALEANTQMIEQGMFGGGPRAAGAVPVHLRGQLLAEALQTQKLNLGVFGN